MSLKFHIETFGCQMNQGDSDLMHLSLCDQGFTPATGEDDADIVLFNTCSVREHAEKRALARIGMAHNRMRNSGGTVVVAGCMAQRLGQSLIDQGLADLVIGTYRDPDAGEIVSRYLRGQTGPVHTATASTDFITRIDPGSLERRKLSWREWVTITHGCQNFCTYCIVPMVRGPLISFPSNRIIEYVRGLADRGVTEITLLGQNVNQYGQDSGDIPFYSLLERVSEIKGIVKICFLTSHPRDFNREIIDVIRDSENIAPSIHLPLQSGSDEILRMMNRGYTLEHYIDIAGQLEKELPRHSLTTDLIVGFPGETEDDFKATLRVVREIRFDDAFMYAYSPRSGTPAADLPETISHDEKMGRLKQLIDLQREMAVEKLRNRIGSVETVSVERVSRKSQGDMMGQTFLNHPVVFPGSEALIGKHVKVEITGIIGSTLAGHAI